MREHKRERVVREAEFALATAMLQWNEAHGYNLTDAERLRVIASELGGSLSRMAKYQIRRERHGDENQPGGLA